MCVALCFGKFLWGWPRQTGIGYTIHNSANGHAGWGAAAIGARRGGTYTRGVLEKMAVGVFQKITRGGSKDYPWGCFKKLPVGVFQY
eukprot:COSAG02_NODE_2716_length_8169_cov_30.441293_1_plen_86_part_10